MFLAERSLINHGQMLHSLRLEKRLTPARILTIIRKHKGFSLRRLGITGKPNLRVLPHNYRSTLEPWR